MSKLTTFAKNAILDEVFRNVGYTPPVTVYAALFTVAPTVAGGGTEVTGGGYARQAITFGAASGGVVSNSNTPTWTASGANYGTVVAVGYFDASSGGNLLAFDAFTGVVVNDGNTISIPSAPSPTATITLD